jgi:ADP-ribose pyrophosphatase YjhB (NUDIX family)
MHLPTPLATAEACLLYAEDWIAEPERTDEEVIALLDTIRAQTGEDVKFLLCAVALLYNAQGEILLLRRTSTDPSYPETYCLPGGTFDAREGDMTLEDTVRRETTQETNLVGIPGAQHGTLHATLPKKKRVYSITAFAMDLDPTVPQELKLSHEHDIPLYIVPDLALEQDRSGTLAIAGDATRMWLRGWGG